MSGRHKKSYQLPLKIKAYGGLVVGAALAGTVLASAAAATPDAFMSSVSGRPGTTADSGQSEILASTTLPEDSTQPKRAGESPANDGKSAEKAENAEKSPVTAAESSEKAATGQAESSEKKENAEKSSEKESSEKAAKAAKPAEKSETESESAKKVTAAQVIKLAKSQLGEAENGSGETKFNKWFMGDKRALRTVKRDGGSLGGYEDAAWCSMFVSWVGTKLGFSSQMGFDAWTVKHAEWFKKNDRWGTKPKPGAVTFFSWDGGNDIYDINHVGFTIKDKGNGKIQTVEGNTANEVAVRVRDKGDVVGYGYPDYAK